MEGVGAPVEPSPLLTASLFRMLRDLIRFGFCSTDDDAPALLSVVSGMLSTASHFDGGPAPPPASAPATAAGAQAGQAADAARPGLAQKSSGWMLAPPQRVTPRSYVRMIDEDETDAEARNVAARREAAAAASAYADDEEAAALVAAGVGGPLRAAHLSGELRLMHAELGGGYGGGAHGDETPHEHTSRVSSAARP